MTSGQIGGLIGFSLLLSLGQALFKFSAMAPQGQVAGGMRLANVLQHPSFWIALVVYGVATLLWTYLLQYIPLSRAYPFAALGFLFVPLLAMFLFGEKLTIGYAVGIILIICGILVTTRS